MPTSRASPDRELLARQELVSFVSLCRSLLPARQYRAFLLSYLHGLRAREVAGLCETSASAVYCLLHRARRRLAAAGIIVAGRSPC